MRPRAVAVVGASADENSLGGWSLANLAKGGFTGEVYPVNPRYDELGELRCYPTLRDTPSRPDLVIFAVGDSRIESVLDDAIAQGVPAAVIMSSLVIDDDTPPLLTERVRNKIRDSGMLVCGGNGMGFYNVRDGVWACGFDTCEHPPPGKVSLISHSGAGMCGIIDCEERLRINVAVSCGNELSVTMDEYLDFVLDLPETRAVGLFVETARNPEGFRAALAKAASRRIPVVALKVGRTEEAARLTVSHSGAIAGDDATYDALFDRYGVQRVRDMDELATTLIMFSEMFPIAGGGLVTLHDSGGERQLLLDLADEVGVPLTVLSESSVTALQATLDPELPAVNPLDAWSRGGPDAAQRMTRCLTVLMQDSGAAFAGLIHDRAPDGKIYLSYLEYMQKAQAATGKPVALVSSRQGTGDDRSAIDSTHHGLPVLDGVTSFLVGARCLMAYRDFLKTPCAQSPKVESELLQRWRERLLDGSGVDESLALQMLQDFGLPAVSETVVTSEEECLAAATVIGYPLVLKTAVPGIAHKTEASGVFLDVCDDGALSQAYDSLQRNVGPRAVVAPMIGGDAEMILGMRRDPQFGAVVIVGFGGVLAETIGDVFFALPPFNAEFVRTRLDKLKLRPVLDGVRGKPPLNLDAFCEMAAAFSHMVDALAGVLDEVDVNPVIVGRKTCVAVDALVVPVREP
jgi:acyl-CoA synthetase (NDP forming)